MKTAFLSYDNHGNPTTIIEAVGTAQQRTTKITWHPILSRPLTITRESVAAPGCFASSSDTCAVHELIWDYDQPTNGNYSQSYNSNPTNFVYQMVEVGVTSQGLSGTLAGSGSGQSIHTVQLQRDAAERITMIAGPVSFQPATFDYNASLTVFDYSPITGYLSQETQVANSTTRLITTFGFDGNGRITTIVDPNLNTTTNTFNAAGMLLSSGISGRFKRSQEWRNLYSRSRRECHPDHCSRWDGRLN